MIKLKITRQKYEIPTQLGAMLNFKHNTPWMLKKKSPESDNRTRAIAFNY
ncbi:MAG: hypothetical protein HYZ14_08950 [Bacteroidetes bacterium]|nr:hypothetical protein [Bacteroidota bacterium]